MPARPSSVASLWMGVVAGVLVLTGCAGGGPDARTPSDPPPTAAITAPHPARGAAVPDVAALFVAALGGQFHPDGPAAEPRAYVRDRTYCSALLREPPCPPEPITDDVQRAVVAALGGRLHFVANPPRPAEGTTVVITLGPPHIKGDRATVPVETECGPMCGMGEVLVLERHGAGWLRTGTTARAWIS